MIRRTSTTVLLSTLLPLCGGTVGAQGTDGPAEPVPAEPAPDEATDVSIAGTTTTDLVPSGTQWDRVPFSQVPPIDNGFATTIDPALLGRRVIDAEALLRYWLEEGGLQEPARWRQGYTQRLGYYTSSGRLREITSLDSFPGFDEDLTLFPGRPLRYRNNAFGIRLYNDGREIPTNRGGFFSDYGYYSSSTNYFGGYAYSGSRRTYLGPPLIELVRRIDYNLVLEQPERVAPEPPDPALVAIDEEAWNRAAQVYLERDEEAEDDDGTNRRLAGIVLALDGQPERAARHIAAALERDPTLRENPVDGEAIGLPKSDLTSAQARAAREAVRTGSPDLWALAATLAGARGSSTQRALWARYDAALERDW